MRDSASLDLVMLVSDGLYFNNSLDVHGPERLVPRSDELAELIAHHVQLVLLHRDLEERTGVDRGDLLHG